MATETVWAVGPNGEFQEILVQVPDPIATPAYQPLSSEIPPNPVPASPPPDQTMGQGGTPFSDSSGMTRPPVYVQPPVLGQGPDELTALTSGLSLPTPPPIQYQPVTPAPLAPPPKGQVSDAPVNTTQELRQKLSLPQLPAALSPVQAPGTGPVVGTVGGFDLSRIPLWVWIVGGVLIATRVLKG